MKVKESSPRLSPVAMLKVSGVATSVMNAGKASLQSSQRTLATESLTPRESEVLQILASGLANKEIAARLAISEHTAKFHVASILGKVGAGSRTEAVSIGIRCGLVLL
ncbi:MAG: LuxR C-terminal-related transcriptional regulator [Acidobacteriia bacterium]|nr:LuxR C-terminal-related transcriptional regulator [Terriglobia bacterium]